MPRDLEQRCQRHPRARHGRPAAGRTPAIRARRWHSRRSPTCCSRGSCATTRPIPSWPDRDRFVLSNGHASILQYSMLYLTGYGLELRGPPRSSASGDRARPATPRCTTLAGVEVTTGPLGQGFANGVGMAIAERFLRPQFGPEADRPPHLRHLRRRRPDGGRQPRGGLARRPPRARPPRVCLRRQPHHHRRRRPSSPTPTTSASASRPTAGTSSTSARSANDLDALEGGPAPGHGRGGPPLAAHPCAATSAGPRRTAPTPRRRTATPSAPTRSARRRRSSGCRSTRTSTSPTTSSTSTASAPAAAAAAPSARMGAPPEPSRASRHASASTPASPGAASTGWADDLPAFEAGTKLATRKAINECLKATAAGIPGLIAGAGRPHGQHRGRASGAGRGRSAMRAPGRATRCTSGSASTPWPRP